MQKREAEFGRLFRHWIKANRPHESAAYELKQTLTDSIPFSDVQDHQIDALLAVEDAHLLYKIPDDSRGVKPFDMVYLTRAKAYVVIRFPEWFCGIRVKVFIEEKKTSKRKSLTARRALDIATFSVRL
jgi:hypothetical protein